MPRPKKKPVMVVKCPRIASIREKLDDQGELSVDDIAAQAAIEMKVDIDVAIGFAIAVVGKKSSCGRERYGAQDLCRSCYNACKVWDRRGADVKYNSSSNGKARLARYRQEKIVSRLLEVDQEQARIQKLIESRQALFSSLTGGEGDLSNLDEKSKTVLICYYALDGNPPLTLRQIGEKFGCSAQRMAQVKDVAVEKIKKNA